MNELRYKIYILVPTLIYSAIFAWLVFGPKPIVEDPGKYDYLMVYTFGYEDVSKGVFMQRVRIYDQQEECTRIAKPLNFRKTQAIVLVKNIRLRVVYVACYQILKMTGPERDEYNRQLFYIVGPVVRQLP